MNRRRMGALAAAGALVLVVGVLIGIRIAAPAGSAVPVATATVLPATAPTAAPSPTPVAPSLPKGLGTQYYESDNGDDGQVALRYVGNQVVAQVTYGLSLGANPAYTGTVTGTTLTAKAPSLPALHNPHAQDTLVVRVTRPGEAEVTLGYAKNDVGVATANVTFRATCGRRTDTYRYQSCQALKP